MKKIETNVDKFVLQIIKSVMLVEITFIQMVIGMEKE